MTAHNSYDDKKIVCYSFSVFDKRVIAKAFKPEIKKLQKQIEATKNDPDNEGQAK